MPLDEILRNSAPAIGGFLLAIAGFALSHSHRRASQRRRDAALHKPAE